jgi:hypothetical protein
MEVKGTRQKFNELVQLRGDIIMELRKTVEIIAEGSAAAANHYVESVICYLAYLAYLGEPVDHIKLWSEFDKSEVELIWKVA